MSEWSKKIYSTTKALPDLPAGTRVEVLHDAGQLLCVRPLKTEAVAWVRKSEISKSFQLRFDDLEWLEPTLSVSSLIQSVG